MAAIAKVTFLCLLASLTVNCDVSVKDVNLKMVKTNFDIAKALEETRKGLATVNNLTSGVIELAHFNAVVSPIISETIGSSVNAFTDEEWKSNSIEAINEYVRRQIVEEEIINLKVEVRSIYHQINDINNPNVTRQRIENIINMIFGDIWGIKFLLSSPLTIFRKYPELVFMPLSVLAQFIAVHETFAKQVAPKLSDLNLPCEMLDLITDYRSSYVFKRVINTDYELTKPTDIGRHKIISNSTRHIASLILQKNFSRLGYKKHNPTIKYCDAIGDCSAMSVPNGYAIVIDKLSQQCLTFSQVNGIKCPKQYMKALRHAIEQQFDQIANLMNDFCPNSIQSKRKPTGFGRLTIIFLDAFGEFLPDGSYCDPFYGHCDLYMNVQINGSLAYTTQTHTAVPRAYFAEMYTTPIIFETSLINVTLWDEDGGLLGKDDSLFYLEASARWFKENGYHRERSEENYMSWRAEWHAEYNDVDDEP